jgi:3-methyladenine DNA glycosylase AlkC
MEPLKEMFNKNFYQKLGEEFHKADKNFNAKLFVAEVTKNLSELELNQRLRNTSVVLKNFLPADFKKSVETMKKVATKMGNGYTQLVFPDFIGLYGAEHLQFSLDALKYFTQFGSSEFAIRVFLKNEFDKTIKEMHLWAKDKNHHVRRLASEGSRPRLPWSFKLDRVIENPKHTLSILEILKADEELYVRKSVANHLNDISKEHPKVLLQVIKNWKGKSKHTDWILKHASRTLLKKGDTAALGHFGIKHNSAIEISNFKIVNSKIKIGSELKFAFALKNNSNKKVKVRLEYAIYFKVANNKLSKKVFKISEREILGKEVLLMEKKHSFKIISTRKYYTGVQKVALIVNGKETEALAFTLS